jgi:hypothetical protein
LTAARAAVTRSVSIRTRSSELLLEVPADGWQDGVLAVSPGMLSDDTFVAVKLTH